MSELPNCPACASPYTYTDGQQLLCPECGHEWTNQADTESRQDETMVHDANGNLLVDGDTVAVTKDLKVKGSSSAIKVGTRVKNIRLVEGDHEIDCKIEGFGAMKLKAKFVKKA